MEKGKPLLHWAGFLLVIAATAVISLTAQGGEKGPGPAPGATQPDLITIDTLAAQGKLELPAVTFSHDKHTEALRKENKGCETCHSAADGRLSLAYMRTGATNPATIKDIYHANCIGCHQQDVARGKASGPLDGFCRDCHNARPAQALQLNASLGKVLHYRHVISKDMPQAPGSKDNCGLCHHELDLKLQKLVYVPGKESNCSTCHLEKPRDGVMSLKQAAHEQCVLCHLDLARKKVAESLPVNCAECHGAAAQARIAKNNQAALAKLPNQEVPRLRRGQPDAVLLTYKQPAAAGMPGKILSATPVAFDHKAHEKYTGSCQSCHHAGIEACDKCHTLGGAKEGGFVTFEQAMHKKSSQISCVGCHTAKQAQPNCAGCHHGIVETGGPSKASCKLCHLSTETAAQLAGMTPAAKNDLAADVLKDRNMHPGTFAMTDVPETVTIKELSDKYMPVEFKHREHVQALVKAAQGSALADYFHNDKGTLCQGCHHNSPPAKQPPTCISCHKNVVGQASFDPREENRPGLLAAQHGQCMSCHKYMGVKPTATSCLECHKEKK
jgi:nitrate/TMAO reductase-like tetraheme cytochrome c subunit